MRLLDWFLGCTHRETSRVFGRKFNSYVVCLNCGAEFEYCLRTMRRGKEIKRQPLTPDIVMQERTRPEASQEFDVDRVLSRYEQQMRTKA